MGPGKIAPTPPPRIYGTSTTTPLEIGPENRSNYPPSNLRTSTNTPPRNRPGNRSNYPPSNWRNFIDYPPPLEIEPPLFRTLATALASISKEALFGIPIPWMCVKCGAVRDAVFSSPNECDKILKIPNDQTEPTDYIAIVVRIRCNTHSQNRKRSSNLAQAHLTLALAASTTPPPKPSVSPK